MMASDEMTPASDDNGPTWEGKIESNPALESVEKRRLTSGR